jgi:Flp pilus assembly protein TadG
LTNNYPFEIKFYIIFFFLLEGESKMLPSRKLRDQKGAALVEFAIALPLIVLLLFGIIEFGVLLYNKQVITNASREGARAAINPLPLLTPPDVVTVVENYCDQNLITFGTNNPVSVSPPDANRVFPQEVTITVTWNYGFLVPSIIGLGPTITIGGQTTMKMM